ncbi:MAG TPA: dihydrolipoamide acetyltransferase family protein [Planctomycetota bacterium]|nr:dihydrolipoamide acetyltransferase family protein [Planctomycetota bacterium]
MATDVIMPKIAESIFEGTLTKWLKKLGDPVKQDEPLFEISTDKVDTEIPSPVAGILSEVLVKEGETVAINTVVGRIGAGGAVPAAAPPAPRREAAMAATPRIEPHVVGRPSVEAPSEEGRIFASPLVKKMAEKAGIDLAELEGSGFKGRITKQDLEEFISRKGGGSPAAVVQALPPAAPVETREIKISAPTSEMPGVKAVITGPTETAKMTPMRKAIADHMVMSRRTSAHVSTFWEADLSRVVALREREKSDYERVYNTRLTLTTFFASAAIRALKEFPVVNAMVDGDKIMYYRYVNLGVAVALPEGLIVPVVKGADEMSFLGLSRSINDLAERSRGKKLKIEEVQGGTFTLTNPGVYGGLIGTPIINQPQVAILGVGGVQKRVVVTAGDAISVRPMVYLSLSFDHRIIDGAVADQFMAHVKKTLEQWELPLK